MTEKRYEPSDEEIQNAEKRMTASDKMHSQARAFSYNIIADEFIKKDQGIPEQYKSDPSIMEWHKDNYEVGGSSFNEELKKAENHRQYYYDKIFDGSDKQLELIKTFAPFIVMSSDEQYSLDTFRDTLTNMDLDLSSFVFLINYFFYKEYFPGHAIVSADDTDVFKDGIGSKSNYLRHQAGILSSIVRDELLSKYVFNLPHKYIDDRPMNENFFRPRTEEDERKEKEDERKEIGEYALPFSTLKKKYIKYFDKRMEQTESVPSDIAKIAQNSKSAKHHENFAKNFGYIERFAPELITNMKFLFRRRKTIDLGCGDRALGMAKMALKWGATEYVGVDKYNQTEEVNDYGEKYDVGCISVKGDMLEFVSQETDNSSAVIINGIDEFIFDESKAGNITYLDKLANEIARVSGSSHFVIGINSNIIFERLKKLGYNEENFDFPDSLPVIILKKS